MLSVLSKQECLKIFVGDDAQQIYEWRGAVNALGYFSGAPELLLSQLFRFGEAIAQVANKILATLEEPTQLRLKGLPSIPSKIAAVADPVCILCRTNAVAVGQLLASIAAGKKPFLVGGGADVISFVKGAQELQERGSTGHPDLACFTSWAEVQQYVKEDEGEDLKLMVNIIDGFGTEAIIKGLESMPREQDADLVISTAHKSKGREWDTVRLANDFPVVDKCCDADRKLLYVAVTRAKLVLDVSSCPYFTGEEGDVIAGQQAECPGRGCSKASCLGLIPPAPSTPPAPTEFTWSRDKDRWVVRGPKGYEGKDVDVVRKDGSKSRKRPGTVQKYYGTAALYSVR